MSGNWFNNIFINGWPEAVFGVMFPILYCTLCVTGITIDNVGYIWPDNSVVILWNGYKWYTAL